MILLVAAVALLLAAIALLIVTGLVVGAFLRQDRAIRRMQQETAARTARGIAGAAR